MTDTQKNIENYKSMLPGLKEKVMAAAMLLLISLATAVSASFAWVTLSFAPEITGMSTTVAANGNLEIALVSPDGERPRESAVGDSFAAVGQNIVAANQTWGNLVNLSDESYGLQNIVLRPALLSSSLNLLENPLRGANYGDDGRMETSYNEQFRFTNWVPPQNNLEGYFEYSNVPQYGVRAISTVVQTFKDNNSAQFQVLLTEVQGLRSATETRYNTMLDNQAYIDALARLIGDYMTSTLNDGEAVNVADQMDEIYALMKEFDGIIDGFADTVLAMANLQVYNKYGVKEYEAHTYKTYEELAAATDLSSRGVSMEMLSKYKTMRKDYKQVLYGDGQTDLTKPETFDSIEDYYKYAANNSSVNIDIMVLEPYINKLVKISTCKIEYQGSTYSVGSFPKKTALNIVMNGDTVKAKIAEGILKDFEQLTGCRMYKENVKVKAKYIMTATITAETITTTATSPSTYQKDETATKKVAEEKQGDVVIEAKDTYGMAVDFWVRTNAAYSFLVLEGNVLTEPKTERAMGKDQQGNTVELWSVDITRTVTNENGEKEDVIESVAVYPDSEGIWRRAEGHGTIYKVTRDVEVKDANGKPVAPDGCTITDPVFKETADNGKLDLYTVNITKSGTTERDVNVYQDENGTWRRADDGTPIYKVEIVQEPQEGQKVTKPKERYETTYKVIGYEGENRVWQENNKLDVTSTTQGSGSCYVFYAEDPTQQDSSLRLLSNLRVAFIDSTQEGTATYGQLVAMARLDLENRYEEAGRVILPLVLTDDGSEHLSKDANGELVILPLERNQPARITAVVFLDGRELTNSDVLAANSIQGQLNIQFGSTAAMAQVKNETLEMKTRSVKVVASKSASSFPEDNSNIINYKFDGSEPLKVYVRLKVDGEQPNNVKAFFMRKVNSTQGAREQSFDLYPQGEYFVGEYEFSAPGNYVLQTVQLDGVDYDLDTRTAEERKNPNIKPDYPQVSVEGFGITSLTVTCNGKPLDAELMTIMTGAQQVSTNVTVRLANSAQMPKDVSLQFRKKEDGSRVTVLMKGDGSGRWTGSANINSSGTYVLQYIIMDGRADELDASMQKTVEVYCGIKVRITDGGAMYRNMVWDNIPKEIPVYVEVMDNTDKPIKYRSDVRLTYYKNNSSADKLDTDLEWVDSNERYEGTLKVEGPGRYTFAYVNVGVNALTNTVETPPVYVCISPDPARYFDAAPMQGEVYRLSTGKTGDSVQMGIRLANADGATVMAVLYNSERPNPDSDDGLYYVMATAGKAEEVGGVSVNPFMFDLPRYRDVDGKEYQSGNWTIVELRVGDVYGEGSVFYPASEDMKDAMSIKMPDADQKDNAENTADDLRVKVVHAKFTFSGTGANFGSSTSRTKYFLDGETVTADTHKMKITLTDQNGKALNTDYLDITDAQLIYMHMNGSALSHGGYTPPDGAIPKDANLLLTAGMDQNGTFTFTQSVNLTIAGEYVGKDLQVTVTEKSTGDKVEFKYTSTDNKSPADGYTQISMPKYELYTIKPTVTLGSATLVGSAAYAVDKNTGENSYLEDTWTSQKIDSGCLPDYKYTGTVHADHVLASENTQYKSRLENNNRTIWLYFKCGHTSTTRTYDAGTRNNVSSGPESGKMKGHTYSYGSSGEGVPRVTMKLEGLGATGIGNAAKAELVFTKEGGGNVIMLTQYTSKGSGSWKGDYAANGTDRFAWDGSSADCTRFIGAMENGVASYNGDMKTPAGTIKSNRLEVTAGGQVYVFTIDEFIIHNPY